MKRLLVQLIVILIPVPAVCTPIRFSFPWKHHHREVRRTHSHEQYGLASWYGPGNQGRETASGQRFDEHQLTAAHRTLPFGSRVRVTNLRNGRSVVVKINDRGPWVYTRVIDLSEAAAERLGFRRHGLAPVRIRVLRRPEQDYTEASVDQEFSRWPPAG